MGTDQLADVAAEDVSFNHFHLFIGEKPFGLGQGGDADVVVYQIRLSNSTSGTSLDTRTASLTGPRDSPSSGQICQYRCKEYK